METAQCLTDDFLTALADEQLEQDERSRAHHHLAQCAACRDLVALALEREDEPQEREPPELLLEAPADWTPPVAFDEFRMIQPIGRGSMGAVYLARDLQLDRQVAVKFIATASPDALARRHFQNEARAIARLQHPNVVTVFRVGEVQGLPYIVSEYLVGQSLDEISGPLPWRRVLSLGIGLARGLAAAHRQGVLHRDLKPANVFLTSSDEVKLLDFGLAELSNAGDAAGSRGANVVAGTPLYMGPELFLGAAATPQSDLYSLGLVLHQMCTGQVPRARPGLGILPLSESAPGIDLDFASIVDRCLRVEPSERFASADALRAELERLHIPDDSFSGNPYRGLAPFEAEHRALFFGRDGDIRAVLERLRSQSLMLVAGDSGVGKSSLCRAGIIPRVVQGALDGFRDFQVRTLEPGRWPLAALAAALAPLLGSTEPELRARLAGSPQELGSALRAAYQEGRGLMLFIDQLEELITLSDPAQAASFASILGELALPSTGVRVLLAVRGDFLTRLGMLPGLGDRVEQALYLLRPLSPDGVREAITGPMRSRGVSFESEQLLNVLVEATAREAGSLPLLQFTLAELWERRDRARECITREALDKLGGVAGALSLHADDVLSRLDRAGQQVARQLFSLLITAEGTRCERSEEELAARSRDAGAVLRVLVAGRLLHARAVEGRTSYEIAHEALITNWGTMRRWLDEDAGQRALRQRVEVSSAEWERSGRSGELLWRGRPLDEAQGLDMAALGPREQLFLRTSQKAVRRQRLRRWMAVALVIALGLAIRLYLYVETQAFVQAKMTEARDAAGQAWVFDQNARESRDSAVSLYRAPVSASSDSNQMREFWRSAEGHWARALYEVKQANKHYSEAERTISSAFSRVPGHPEARKLLIDTLGRRFKLADTFHQTDERDRIWEDLKVLVGEEVSILKALRPPAKLEVVTTPQGAAVTIKRYEEVEGRLTLQPVDGGEQLGTTPIVMEGFPAGSYYLQITREGYAPVGLPVLLQAGQSELVKVPLLRNVPTDFIYIPPGCFLTGTTDPEVLRTEFLESAPLHQVCLKEGYLIGKYEVTLGEWIAYLESRPNDSDAYEVLLNPENNSSGKKFKLEKLSDGAWRLTFLREGKAPLQAHEEERFLYPKREKRGDHKWLRFPLAGVSFSHIQGFLRWLDEEGHPKGARLCTEWEWTRAARGADARRYPHGDQLRPEDANIDATYGRNDESYGPDEVGTHPNSISPFGLYDTAGNVFEVTLAQAAKPEEGAFIQMGGAWYYPALSALVAARAASASVQRDARVGFRVCASVPAQ
jgi:formylglycine-generating enzyme required for sulfatase activity